MSEAQKRDPALGASSANDAPAKKKLQRKWTSSEEIRSMQEKLGLSDKQLSEALFLSPNVVSSWHRQGKAPAWAELACKALLKDLKKEKLLVVSVSLESEKPLVDIIHALGATVKARIT